MTFNLHCNLLSSPTKTSGKMFYLNLVLLFKIFLLIHGTKLQCNHSKIITAYLGVGLQLVWIVIWLQWSSQSSRQLENLCVHLSQEIMLKNYFWLLSRIPITCLLPGVIGFQSFNANRVPTGMIPHLLSVQHLLSDAKRHWWIKLLFPHFKFF